MSSWPTGPWGRCSRRPRRHPRRLRGARGLQRGPQRHPARHRPRRSTTPTSTAGVGLRRDQHLRRQPRQPRRVRHHRADLRTVRGRRPDRRARSPTRCPPPTGRAGCWARSARAPSCRPWATCPTPTLRDAYQRNAAGLIAGGARRADHRDLPGPAAGQGRRSSAPSGPSPPRARHGADHRPGHHRDQRRDAAGLGDRRGADRARAARLDLIGLNCATGPAEMSEHLRYLARHATCGLSCMPNAGLPELDLRRRPLPAERPASWPTRTRPSPASTGCRWSAAAAARRPSTFARWSSGSRGQRGRARAAAAPRGRRRLALPARAVPAGHLLPGHRRAHQRQRLQGVPRGDAGAALGRLRRDRARPGPRRRAHARPVHRLRRPRRRRRHEGAGVPLRHRLHPADRARLHRARRPRGGAGDARRPRGDQLGQLRGRRRPGARASTRS